MRYLRLFENFNKDKLISEIETITHILQDEYHNVNIRKGEENSILIEIEISNFPEIKDAVYNDYMSNIDGDDEDFDYFSDLDLDDNITEEILELEEMIEFKSRLEDICKNYKCYYKAFSLYNSGIYFLIQAGIGNTI